MFLWISQIKTSVSVNVCELSCIECVSNHIIPAGNVMDSENLNQKDETGCLT